MTKNKYKKIGGGTLRLKNGQKVRANEEFYAYEQDIPVAFADSIDLIDGQVEVREEKKPPVMPKIKKLPEYSIEPRGGGFYNVVDVSGKAINEKALRKKKAEELLQSLV